MRILFLIIVIIHGLIHLMGFVKAFQLADITQLTQSISKPIGLVWLMCTLLFVIIAIVLLLKQDWWWMLGSVAVILSQLLIVLSWQDAKFGTIANIIILVVVILGFGAWRFNLQINSEVEHILSQQNRIEKMVVTEHMLESLPTPVQKWLTASGLVGKESINTAFLKQTVRMKLKPEQKDWTKANVEQYITTDKPAFLWKVNASMMGIIDMVGRDLYKDGHGGMQIKLASLLPIVDVANNEKVDQASLQRYLAELPWYPSAALSPFITWESIDDFSAIATMSYNNVTGSVTFFFNENGEFIKCRALRYKDSDENAQPLEWYGDVKESKVINGVKVPTKIDISWVLEEGIFTWYKLEIKEVEYNRR